MSNQYYDYQLTLDKLIRKAALIYPDVEVVHAPPGGPIIRSNYAKEWDRIQRLGSALEELGVSPGEPGKFGSRIAVLDWNTIRHFELYYGVPMYGAVLHTVNVLLAPEDIIYTLLQAQDEVLFINEDFISLARIVTSLVKSIKKVVIMSDELEHEEVSFDGVKVYWYEDLIRDARPYNFPELSENTVATMMFTSGTTGRPKGTYFTHRQLVLHAMSVALSLSAPPINANIYDVAMPLVPMFHVHAWGLPYIATLVGIKQVYPGRFDWGWVLKLIKDEGVTITNGVPTILFNLLYHPDSPKYDLRGLKFIVGGSALPRGLLEEASRRGIHVVQGFGLTETAPVILLTMEKANMRNWPEDRKRELVLSAGLPIPLVDIRVVDGQGRDVPRDGKTMGELVVRAPWITREYLNDPEKTRNAWRDGWFHTDDIAVWDSEGYVWIMDRAKDVIKSGGEWISSTRLEDLISTHPAVYEVAVIGVPHPKWGERPVAIVVPKPGQKVTEEEIRNYLMGLVNEGKMPKWWIPDKVVIVESELPKTSTGKVDKKVLRERFQITLE
ncbi:long-chain fatty acid--CoA ligase [Vulcanisaeta distributa]|uniref:AMP-dependent synthetase and ligase n=1 Tax=Vulcanisaeta distributa (strain DSM 14429 / JCM 11212 / NBRC 100878 / IC-017) TaxID=572478 RepID=E1QT70_VULDI|nr:long-chain fatty acid--CoA ligase [Vulcanisaeta distributa]ADN49662.1 AMP-dependent synthetase and ligase [Vulcanisaeta distributa DSM 14429]